MRMPLLLVLSVLALGCASRSQASPDPALAGSWRIYSEEISYDYGGSGTIAPAAWTLVLDPDGTWRFGQSNGTWSVANITSRDWNSWGMDPYGPTRKIVLSGWDGYSADGPIDESPSGDSFWAIYRPKDQDTFPGIVQMRFGRIRAGG